MASLVEQKPQRIQEVKARIIALENSLDSNDEDQLIDQQDKRAEGYAKIIVETLVSMIKEAKQPIQTITTAAAGTWTSQPEPTSGSGLYIG